MSAGKLGFGCLRLPKDREGDIDINQTCEMIDIYMESGMNYFDTAYVYEGSEEALGTCLVQRYRRESFKLTTKLHGNRARTKREFEEEIFISLERTGAEYFDYLLLHAVNPVHIKKYIEYDAFSYVEKLKRQGLIRDWAISTHAQAEFVDFFLTEHPDVAFVQLQINYLDWLDRTVQAKANYEVARAHNKPIVVMEPVKGGLLANPPDAIKRIFTQRSDASPSSWALRYAASLPGVENVLSGMSNTNQVRDNISFMGENFIPLSDDEQKTIESVREAFLGIDHIKCTGCRYCVKDCPRSIPIPDIFKARNISIIYNQEKRSINEYRRVTKKGFGADACVACGNCEIVCPQRLPIIKLMRELKDIYA